MYQIQITFKSSSKTKHSEHFSGHGLALNVLISVTLLFSKLLQNFGTLNVLYLKAWNKWRRPLAEAACKPGTISHEGEPIC